MGTFWGAKVGNFGFVFGFVFWTCWSTFGEIWGQFGGTNRPKRSQDEPKRAIMSFKVLKTCICKNCRKHKVFKGVWGPRPPKTATTSQEGSQEPTEELQNLNRIIPAKNPYRREK